MLLLEEKSGILPMQAANYKSEIPRTFIEIPGDFSFLLTGW
jgi:hypothetical protein